MLAKRFFEYQDSINRALDEAIPQKDCLYGNVFEAMRYSLNAEPAKAGAAVEPFDYVIGAYSKIVIRNEYTNAKGKNVLEFVVVKAEDLEATIENRLEKPINSPRRNPVRSFHISTF